jgi:hypothetical protein
MFTALGMPSPTMNFQFANLPSAQIRSRILHEFDHALGIVHEHSRTSSSIHIDLEKPREHCRGIGHDIMWYLGEYEVNGDSSITDLFPHDPESIMHYDIAAQVTRNSTAMHAPSRLSRKDKASIAYLYPKPCGGTIKLLKDRETEEQGTSPQRFSGCQGLRTVQQPVSRVVVGTSSFS